MRTWLEREQRTARLIKTVYPLIKQPFNAEDIWHLCRLTWITKDSRTRSVSDAYLKSTKMPALRGILCVPDDAPVDEIIRQIIRRAGVSKTAAHDMIKGETGIVNFYTVYRNSSLKWIKRNITDVRRLVQMAAKLQDDAQAEKLRLDLDDLPSLPNQKKGVFMPPSNLLSPLLMCVDPRSRFPTLNGRVAKFLAKIGRGSATPLSQHVSLVRLMDDLAYSDALVLDTAIDAQSDNFVAKCKRMVGETRKGQSLKLRDDADLVALAKHRSKKMRRLHNTMTNRLAALLGSRCEEGVGKKTMWDVVVRGSSSNEPSVLVELKSMCDMPSARMAVGQLYDYRRSVAKGRSLKLAVLFPEKPTPEVGEYLGSLGIECLWFTGPNLARVRNSKGTLWQ